MGRNGRRGALYYAPPPARRIAAEAAVGQNAEGMNVGGDRRLPSLHLLRRAVSRRAHPRAPPIDKRNGISAPVRRRGDFLGKAEIGDDGRGGARLAAPPEDVARLDVAVDDSHRIHLGHAVAHAQQELRHLLVLARQLARLQQLKREIRPSVRLAVREEARERHGAHFREKPRLAREPGLRAPVVAHEHLQRNGNAKPHVPRAVHLPAAAAPDERRQAPFAEHVPRREMRTAVHRAVGHAHRLDPVRHRPAPPARRQVRECAQGICTSPDPRRGASC